METTYHSCRGGDSLATEAPTLLMSYMLDIIRQISIDYSKDFTYTVFRTFVRLQERGNGMSTHEAELFNIIYENDNPEQAVLTAIEVFTAFLEQLEEVPKQQPGDLQESA